MSSETYLALATDPAQRSSPRGPQVPGDMSSETAPRTPPPRRAPAAPLQFVPAAASVRAAAPAGDLTDPAASSSARPLADLAARSRAGWSGATRTASAGPQSVALAAARAIEHPAAAAAAPPGDGGSATLRPRMPDLGKAGGWGLLAVAVALAGLLALSSVSSFVNAYRIGEAVVRGESEVLHRLVERDFPRGRWTTAADLEAILADDRDEGLRYLAILGPDDGVVVEAGVSAERPLRPGDHRGVLAWIEDNLAGDGTVARFERMIGPPPRHGDGPPGVDPRAPRPGMDGKAPPPGFDAKAPPPGAAGRPPPPGMEGKAPPPDAAGRPPPPRIVIEFEPRLATAFFRQALRDLVVGLAVAVALVVTAWLSHRQRQRARAAEAGHAERRHLAALGEMSAVLAHEIRNPLASLKGHAQLLEEQLADNERRRAKASRIVEEAVRLEALTTSLLDFVRAGKLKAATGDPRAIARRAVELTDPARVVLDDAGAPEGWYLDAQRVEQALVNLVRNALQASPPGATVELAIRREDGGLAFRVADRGPGVPAELRARIFDPFVTGRTQGTGLGLAVVSRVCERHGGKASVEERPGGGSVFRVWLPPAEREGD
ncbi:sensor histidine kinase [Nannocystis punicea]|uniref:histidine kinase n=1 Tax=Nannocystis punicea TaxID=2995304 RepID=A0ABY7HDX8_9BACT|nr:HAMP domain-containing sensor histidine kinase [Nannocystis poenicansa]WAS97396.1 HAMP domain-containing sensor histidine kinase [Nannocystis poenicansa]